MLNLPFLWAGLFLLCSSALSSQSIRKIERAVLFTIEKSSDDHLIKASITDKDIPDWRLRDQQYYTYYYNNRILENQGGYYGQLLNGTYHKFNKQNRLIEKGKFKQGIRKGIWKYWDDQGQLIRRVRWKKGEAKELLDKSGRLSLFQRIMTKKSTDKKKKVKKDRFPKKEFNDKDKDNKPKKSTKKERTTKSKKTKNTNGN